MPTIHPNEALALADDLHARGRELAEVHSSYLESAMLYDMAENLIAKAREGGPVELDDDEEYVARERGLV